MPATAPRPGSDPRQLFVLTICYAVLIIYGSLYPGIGWHLPASGYLPDQLLPRQLSGTDMVLNLLVYIPLGLLWGRYRHLHDRHGLLPVLLLAGGMSASLEWLQHFLPGRSTSLIDLALNLAGAGLGYQLQRLLLPRSALGQGLLVAKTRWIRDDADLITALLVLLLWAVVQLNPFVPVLSLGGIKQGLMPLINGLTRPALIDLHAMAIHLCAAAAFGLVGLTLLKPGRLCVGLLSLMLLFVLGGKVLVAGQQLTLEAATGTLLAIGLLQVLKHHHRLWPWLGTLAAMVGYILAETHVPAHASQLHTFNWQPFSSQIENVFGLADIAEQMWPFLAAGYFLRLSRLRHQDTALFWTGMIIFAGLAFTLEWTQRGLPGHQGDITDVILALLGWQLAWLFAAPAGDTSRLQRPAATGQALYAFGLLLAASLLTAMLLQPETGNAGQALQPASLPDPAHVPKANLPDFKQAHPRLPHPSAQELAVIRKENPNYVEQRLRRAKEANSLHHKVYDAILAEVLQPGSQDLDELHRELMSLKLGWRGNLQTKPLAMAYDWLYDKWTPEQRQSLLQHTLDGCEYEIRFIRRNQLSPYNVYLYNSPFQALMGCAIAVYGDSPRAEPVMDFTAYYWKDIVLPVWRQIMGTHGGWHEGGEYVGIGIGDAIYQLPNMWRAATGEDLFASEPGIRGFADFLVQRKRPDGEDFRWGDGGLYENPVPDAAALAIELDHPAAYSLDCPNPKRPKPLSWPWGPLPDDRLCQPDARKKLPLSYYADGIGLLVARSDWSPQQTYVTFKAGDNYWSHTHLDQGAFTIYKGGALAIDSGIYPGHYGSDHHLDYSYQTIAHNLVTVTDPDDTVPKPGRNDTLRPIYNDGGQRRIGSGWGLAAPVSLEHWQQQYDIYHTASTLAQYHDKDMAVMVADLTPAYTNTLSGKGTFAHRTRRVESYRRAFVYDRIQDAVVVFDRVEASQTDFKKRWLLHTQTEPGIKGNEFVVELPAEDRSGHDGGRLDGTVLLPADAEYQRIGGPGKEFWLGDRNYDDNGQVEARIKKRAKRGHHLEPGAWRMEISPPHAQRLDYYLVAMRPSLLNHKTTTTVTRLPDRENYFGCELKNGKQRSQWWFAKDGSGVELVRYEGEHEIERRTIR